MFIHSPVYYSRAKHTLSIYLPSTLVLTGSCKGHTLSQQVVFITAVIALIWGMAIKPRLLPANTGCLPSLNIWNLLCKKSLKDNRPVWF